MHFFRLLLIAHSYILFIARLFLAFALTNDAAELLRSAKEKKRGRQALALLIAFVEMLAAACLLVGLFSQLFAFLVTVIGLVRTVLALIERSPRRAFTEALITVLAALVATAGSGAYAFDDLLLL